MPLGTLRPLRSIWLVPALLLALERGPASAILAAVQAPADRQAPGHSHGGGDYRFWKDDAVRREIALTEEQSASLDRSYEQWAQEVAPFVKEMESQKTVLDTMTEQRIVDVPTYTYQVNRVDSLYSHIHQTRIVMLYRALTVLNAEQYRKLQAINDRNHGRHGGSAGLF